MKHVLIKSFLSAIVMLLVNVFPVYASETFYWNGIEVTDYNEESIILPESVTYSRGEARGVFYRLVLLIYLMEEKEKLNLLYKLWLTFDVIKFVMH